MRVFICTLSYWTVSGFVQWICWSLLINWLFFVINKHKTMNNIKLAKKQSVKQFEASSIWMRFPDGTPSILFFPPLFFCPSLPDASLGPYAFSFTAVFLFFPSAAFSPRPPVLGGNQSFRGFKLIMEGIRSYSSDVCEPCCKWQIQEEAGRIWRNPSTRISLKS